MYRIIRRKELADGIKLFDFSAPMIARKAQPGQFVILRVDEKGERIPLTIVDSDSGKGTITLVVHEVGRTTMKLGALNEGDSVIDIAGPLGNPSDIRKYGTVVCVGGGVGAALIYPEVRAFKNAGNRVISIIGARSKDLLIFRDEISAVSDEIFIATDDGSEGHHGFVSDVLGEILGKRRVDLVFAVGPVPMMKAVADITRHKVRTVVSLNPIMIDGTGMCGSCRVEIGGETKFACVDGPEFDAHLVDFDQLMTRNARYLAEERAALGRIKK